MSDGAVGLFDEELRRPLVAEAERLDLIGVPRGEAPGWYAKEAVEVTDESSEEDFIELEGEKDAPASLSALFLPISITDMLAGRAQFVSGLDTALERCWFDDRLDKDGGTGREPSAAVGVDGAPSLLLTVSLLPRIESTLESLKS